MIDDNAASGAVARIAPPTAERAVDDDRPARSATLDWPDAVAQARWRSLEFRLPLMIVTLLAVTIVVFGFLAFTEVRQSSMTAATTQLRTIVTQTVDGIGRNIAQRVEATSALASSPVMTRVLQPKPSGTDREAAEAALARQHVGPDSAVLFAQLAIDASGASRLEEGGELTAIDRDELAKTLGASDSAGAPHVGALYATDGHMRFWLVAPAHAGGARVGALAQLRRLRASAAVQNQVRNLFGQDFSIYYTSNSGSTWTTPAAVPVAPRFDVRAASDSFHVTASDGERLVGAKALVRGTPWVIVLAMTEAAVNARPLAFLRRMLAAGVALLAVGMLLTWWGSRSVTRPLVSLATGARAIAAGNYAHREAVASADELGQLAHAFNSMAERVGESHTQLASRMRESEALALELRQRNADLVHAQAAATDARNASEAARAEAQRASEAKTDFLAMMSHELRTPLSAIAGYAEILQLGLHGALTDAQRTDLERIQANQAHLLRIINDMLDLTQVESGQLSLAMRRVPLHDVVAALEPIILPLIAERGLAFVVSPSVADFTVLAEPDRLTQVLVNLVANASRFTNAGGRIMLHADAVENSGERQVQVHVLDEGIGIPADKLEVIFQPFVQLSGGASRKTQGTGLGLAISRRIAEAMGGTLKVTSSEVGVGSTFTLTLHT